MANINKVTKVSIRHRIDPLIDFQSLSETAESATRKARSIAFQNNETITITIARDGYICRMSKTGKIERIKPLESTKDFPTLEEDLCTA